MEQVDSYRLLRILHARGYVISRDLLFPILWVLHGYFGQIMFLQRCLFVKEEVLLNEIARVGTANEEGRDYL